MQIFKVSIDEGHQTLKQSVCQKICRVARQFERDSTFVSMPQVEDARGQLFEFQRNLLNVGAEVLCLFLAQSEHLFQLGSVSLRKNVELPPRRFELAAEFHILLNGVPLCEVFENLRFMQTDVEQVAGPL